MKDNPMLESGKNSSPWRRHAIVAFVGVLVLGTVFGAGFFAGRLSVRGQFSPFGQRIIPAGGHGAIGRITQIEGTVITLQVREGVSQTILTDNQTRIERGGAKMTRLNLRDLRVGDQIIVTGTPGGQGQIKARLIRVLNPPVLTPTPTGL